MSGHVIRPFESTDDFRACLALQEETWGEGFSERVSMAVLRVAQILGGVAAGAFRDDGTLDGFVFGMTGPRDGVVVHWSDMLAVRRGIRDTGLGRRLKEYQRTFLLERGIERMHWTFDPLQSRNAHLNFAKLGTVAREYRRDMYGESDSPLHRGIGTDRFIVLWPLSSARVERRLAGQGPDPALAEAARPVLGAGSGSDSHPRPGRTLLDREEPVLRMAIPADIAMIMATDMTLAVAWRAATRQVLTHDLDRGYEVREFERGPDVSHYLLTSEPDPLSAPGTRGA